MFRNVFYHTKRSQIHLWETINGVNDYTVIDWVPYVFIKAPKSDIHTIDGVPVVKREFIDYNDYYNFCKFNNHMLENKVKPEIQFLAERYHGIPDADMEVPQLSIYTIDIEIDYKDKFPDPLLAEEPICLISIKDNITKKVITFGEKEYKGDKTDYRHFPDEREMLKRFLMYMHKNPADIITGWNVQGFDMTYIINRLKVLFGKDTKVYNFLSPIRIVRTWMSKKEKVMNVDIGGVTILDYMKIYKWYTPRNLESYGLGFVSNVELGRGKLDYSEYEDLRELYIKDWDKYVDYNVDDVHRVDELEDKLGYIRLIQSLSLLTKVSMKFYDGMTHLIEGAMLTHYRRNKLCAPYMAGGVQEGFPAAFVKEPQKGMHEWVVDVDITSSYPSHIIALNMSVETYIGRIMELKDKEIVYYTRKREFPAFDMYKDDGLAKFRDRKLKSFNMALDRGLIAIAPCGSVFSTKEPGVLAAVEKQIFFKRKEVKGMMKDIRKNELPNLTKDTPEWQARKDRADELFSLQWAIKILLNAMFGILAVPYSRYFNVNMAEAITSCGKHTILKGQDFANDWVKKNGFDEDVVAYIDTDSLFLRLGDYMKLKEPTWKEWPDEKKIEKIRSTSVEIEDYINERVFHEVQLGDYSSQIHDFKIEFKQEIVAKTALFVKKKKYAYWMVNNEGAPADSLEVTGLEIVRSDSSEAVRSRLKKIMEMIMRGTSDDLLLSKIQKYKKELKKVYPEEIAANIGVNNIDKYIVNGKSTKGTPWHVKGVANYRMLLKYFKLEDQYEDIYEGNKCRVFYVKKNPFDIETVTFTRWPKEFEKVLEVDFETMIDKFFIKKIGFLLDPMNKMALLTSGQADKQLGLFF